MTHKYTIRNQVCTRKTKWPIKTSHISPTHASIQVSWKFNFIKLNRWGLNLHLVNYHNPQRFCWVGLKMILFTICSVCPKKSHPFFCCLTPIGWIAYLVALCWLKVYYKLNVKSFHEFCKSIYDFFLQYTYRKQM